MNYFVATRGYQPNDLSKVNKFSLLETIDKMYQKAKSFCLPNVLVLKKDIENSSTIQDSKSLWMKTR